MGVYVHRLVRHADGIRLGLSKAKAINIIQQEAHESVHYKDQRASSHACRRGKKERNAKKR
jgi:hypothetical protein